MKSIWLKKLEDIEIVNQFIIQLKNEEKQGIIIEDLVRRRLKKKLRVYKCKYWNSKVQYINKNLVENKKMEPSNSLELIYEYGTILDIDNT